MDSHRIEIRLIAGDGSWQYSWSADTGNDPNAAAKAANTYIGHLAAAASGAWPAENMQAMVERTDREFPQFEPAHSHGADNGIPHDDSPPQLSEGEQILSINVEPAEPVRAVYVGPQIDFAADAPSNNGDSNGE